MKDIREPTGALSRTPPLTVTVREALALIGIGRTRFYELVAVGQISTIKIGRRRLVHMESLRRLAIDGYEASRPYVRPEQIALDL